ncbi:histidine--tRNA ligase [Neorickettsia sennetsu]|uniref:Histidine--tRNA ligase n=1 Tax=Ehrlichia sennetsu (strain ATCC VR-367 / Miyayama) TaxID=222891 RepID=SYH_EHRS3|nr:histidine--tRNA ligase [Neorickettsia sennetsu]Q2GCZ0.1 RecName: Full=Histidine--tRNA ligase; AltName: Full=Histidyl-tRNA synthetase; Short=HisRS [Neorickettsia sennetsu str. Miyayama]ABD45741.1 histidyl-tRNA synthetase [Neorickettsia sennetsu str. Miyayama]
MSIKINNVKGTRDLFGEQLEKMRLIEQVAKNLSIRYLFTELETPIIEHTELFIRNLGETSDVVNKEIYSFQDKSGHNICLRPEFTAAVTRAFVENFQHIQSPVRLFSFGPLFRYERPQKGRYRQFHQVNFEWIGAKHYLWAVEAIVLAKSFLKEIGIRCEIRVNSLGCSRTREEYKLALINYFQQYKEHLSADSLLRLKKNPLRILDSKDPSEKEIVVGAPRILDYHTDDALKEFESICDILKLLDIEFSVDHRLVRGLDYYSGLIFEFTSPDLGAQDALLGGGAYEQLSENLGGKKVQSIGFAAGIERLIDIMPVLAPTSDKIVSIVPIGEIAEREALKLLFYLRSEGLCADMCYGLSVKSRMKRAERSTVTVILGEEEFSRGESTVRIMETGQQMTVAHEKLLSTLRELLC